MRKLLSFKVPKKVRIAAEHYNATFIAESGNEWKAKHIKGDDERIEIRKIFGCVQLLVIVYKEPYQPEKPQFPEYDGGSKDFYWEQANVFYHADCKRYEKRHQNVRISMNGKLDLTWSDWQELHDVIDEALDILT